MTPEELKALEDQIAKIRKDLVYAQSHLNQLGATASEAAYWSKQRDRLQKELDDITKGK